MTARHSAVSSGTSARAFALGSVVALTALSVPGVAFAAQGDNNGNKNSRQTICHSTNSNTNPYVVITPNKNGDLDGHTHHTGPIWSPDLKAQHISWGDIIPPFDYNNHGTPAHYDGMNWTAEGQAWFANGCAAPSGGGGGTTGGTTGDTTGGTTGDTTGGTTGSTTGGTTGGGSTGGGSTGGGGGGGTSGGGSFTGGGGGTFTGGGGGTTVTPPAVTPSTLPFTGVELGDQVAYGGALVLAGIGTVLLTSRRRPSTR
jgi:hypothetical protein